ncbi:hypothetical protein CAPTEDRAFT_181194 [Capitella teleta]|uniref:15-hydroxyprostaglandin dehydrogenase [NAD(+)] n=1 Tax=Capitella teleta TaxID=283909 RepID=R7UGU0_CAPTE|nr:hypothetical protein CAPTEDRAFT_181194 [Capitella teleta]|eukprot:ELU05318.1 hypothetical protein CAPTEDRAFT_181194 [Capitella teleta]
MFPSHDPTLFLSGAFQSVIKIYGHYDLLVNNAGIGSTPDYEHLLRINLSAVIEGTLSAMSHMRKDKGGRGGLIVNIASTTGLAPAPFAPVYAASKHGVVGFSRSFGPAVEPLGVKVLCLCPSFANTEIHLGRLKYVEKWETIDRIMEVSEVASAFAKLVDEEVNGSVLGVYHDGAEYQFRRKARL